MQETLRAGLSLRFDFDAAPYTPATGWSGRLILVPLTGGDSLLLDATPNGSAYQITVTGEDSASWAAGDYQYFFLVTQGPDVHTTEEGTVAILPSLTALANVDSRSHVKKVLDSLNALIEGKAKRDVANYTISGRQLAHMPMDEILSWKKYYTKLYRQEQERERRKRGLPSRSKIYVRF